MGDNNADNDAFNGKNVLLLGMVFSSEQIPKRGQEYRDRVRCKALEELGYKVHTLDNKHSDTHLSKHCQVSFADTRRMMKAVEAKWDNASFDHVILDYFMSPVGWARERWTDPLFSSTFPALATSGKLAHGATIWLPNLPCIEQSLQEFRAELEPHFVIRKEINPDLNPLYVATDNAEEALLLCPDLITNETQLVHVLRHSQGTGIFYVLELRAPASTVSTNAKVTKANKASKAKVVKSMKKSTK